MVTIRNYLQTDLIIENVRATDKNGLFREFASLLLDQRKIRDDADLVRILLEREALGTTGIGDGVAIPHAKVAGISDMVVAFGRSSVGVEYHAIDAKPVNLIFLLVTPEDRPGDHLKALARISRILKNAALRDGLRMASDRAEIQRLLFEEDAKYPQPAAR
jgi:PTS system nitrogen regulatory IIA component